MKLGPMLVWGILRAHPRSESLDPEVFGRTRKAVMKRMREVWVGCWPNDPDRGGKMFDSAIADGRLRPVQVVVSLRGAP